MLVINTAPPATICEETELELEKLVADELEDQLPLGLEELELDLERLERLHELEDHEPEAWLLLDENDDEDENELDDGGR